jgi:hypothetical protein
MDLWVQGFDPTIKHLWKAGKALDRDDWHSGFSEGLGRAARRENLDAKSGQAFGELDNSTLIAHAN